MQKSKNYLKHKTWILTHEKPTLILVPPHFANAHLCLSNKCVFHYKWSYEGEYPDVDEQFTIKWNDRRLNIDWPITNPILQKRDK